MPYAVLTRPNSLLQRELVFVDGRNIDLMGRYLDVIQDVLDAKGYLIERLELGGSVAKHTYVDGLSDVDALVIQGEGLYGGQLPEEVKRGLADILRRGLPRADVRNIREGTLAVTVEFIDGMEIQLLPAVVSTAGVAIASSDLGHVQPTSMLGRVVNLQTFGDAPRFRRFERLVQRRQVLVVHTTPGIRQRPSTRAELD